jgi:competence protein ComGC
MKAFGLISMLMTLGIIAFVLVKQVGETSQGVPIAQAKVEEDQARDAMALAGEVQLKTSIDSFHEEKQRWPTSLDELRTAGFIEYVPANVDYDPATGEVKPKLSAAAEAQ